MNESASASQAHDDPVGPRSDDGEEAVDFDDDEDNDTFSPYVALDDVTVFEAAELHAIALLADTWDDDLDLEVSALLVQSECTSFTFLSERTKGKVKATQKAKGKGRYPVRPSRLSLEDRRRLKRIEGKNRMSCLWSKGTLGT